jgi:hypothetical protein
MIRRLSLILAAIATSSRAMAQLSGARQHSNFSVRS